MPPLFYCRSKGVFAGRGEGSFGRAKKSFAIDPSPAKTWRCRENFASVGKTLRPCGLTVFALSPKAYFFADSRQFSRCRPHKASVRVRRRCGRPYALANKKTPVPGATTTKIRSPVHPRCLAFVAACGGTFAERGRLENGGDDSYQNSGVSQVIVIASAYRQLLVWIG